MKEKDFAISVLEKTWQVTNKSYIIERHFTLVEDLRFFRNSKKKLIEILKLIANNYTYMKIVQTSNKVSQ